MIRENYACAFKEVIEVLKFTEKEAVNKIPKERILLWKQNQKKDYDFKIETNKSLEEQKLLKESKAILAMIYRDYLATEEQRNAIKARENAELIQIEKEKREKYNPENLFKQYSNDSVEIIPQELSDSVQIVDYENVKWYKKIYLKILSIFKKTKLSGDGYKAN